MTELGIAILALAAIVYGASATAKLRSRAAYRSYQAGFRETALAPPRRLAAAAAGLAVSEVTVTCLSAAGIVMTLLDSATTVAILALAAAALLTGVLAVGVATVLRRGTQARCACFGSGADRPLSGAHLARNLSLFAVLLVGLMASTLANGRPGMAAATVAAGAGAAAGLVITRLDDIIALFAPVPAGGASAARPAHPTLATAVRSQPRAAEPASHHGRPG